MTAIQEKIELYFEKISKIVANIECCQNQNTKRLQQNKTRLHSRNEIIITPIKKKIDLLESSRQLSSYNTKLTV